MFKRDEGIKADWEWLIWSPSQNCLCSKGKAASKETPGCTRLNISSGRKPKSSGSGIKQGLRIYI